MGVPNREVRSFFLFGVRGFGLRRALRRASRRSPGAGLQSNGQNQMFVTNIRSIVIFGIKMLPSDVHYRIFAFECSQLTRAIWVQSCKEATLRKYIAIVFALLMMSAAGLAQIPTAGNVFVGYSLYHGNTGLTDNGTLNGWEGSVEGKVVPFVGIVADVSGHYGTLPDLFTGVDVSTRVQSYLFGPRVSFPAGPFRPYFHVLFGASHLHESSSVLLFSGGETDFADAIGGGIDYHLVPRVSWRVQLDDLQTRFYGARQDNTRFSTGLAVSF